MPLPFLSLRFSVRQLRKSPGFALTAILTLALGIGAVVSVFSVVNAVLLKPLAFRDANRLVVVREGPPSDPEPDNYRHYLRLKKDARTLEDAAIFQSGGASVSPGGDHPHIVGSVATSSNLLQVLGVQPMMGRDFAPGDAVNGASPVVILSYEGWQSFLDGDPQAIGKTLRIGGEPNTVIGVLPSGVKFPDIAWAPKLANQSTGPSLDILIFRPLVPSKWALTDDVQNYNYKVIGRLRPGVTVARAQAELQGLQRAYTRSAHIPVPLGAVVTRLDQDVTAGISSALWLLFAAVGSVLLIGCVNLANLQLARAVAAERETALRAALGASKSRLIWSRLTESLILAAIGGVAGVALAFAGVRLLVLLAPAGVPRLHEVSVSLPVLLFAAALSIGTALLFGILPALRSLGVSPQAALQASSARTANTTQHGGRIRSLLVAGEVACTVVLLIVAGLLLRSFSHVLGQNRGFDSSHVTLAQVDLFAPQYDDSRSTDYSAAKIAFIDRSLAGLQRLPGVQSAAITSAVPLAGETWIDNITRPDHPLPPAEQPDVNVRFVSPDYLATMRIPLAAGRNFSEADRAHPDVVLLSEQAAHEVFPGENPIGHKIGSISPDGKQPTETVIGVVANARINGLKDTAPVAYMPYFAFAPWSVSFLVRSTQPSEALMPEMRRVVWGVDPQVAIPVLKSLDAQLSESVAGDRFQTLLLSSFGAAALLLALLGVYGVLAYSVSLRRQEFGIRIALGSDKGRLMALVLQQAIWPVAAGSGVGLALAFVAVRWLKSLLYETPAADPLAISGTLLLLAGVAAVAAILPARRASRVDPVEVLRAQ